MNENIHWKWIFSFNKCYNVKTKTGKIAPAAKLDKPTASNGRIPLSKMLADLGLSDLLPCYKQYLRSEYGCTSDRITVEKYEEQKSMLENCKKEPLIENGIVLYTKSVRILRRVAA